MWYGLHTSTRSNADFIVSATELLQSVSRSLILITGGTFLLWYVFVTATWPIRMAIADPIAVLVLVTCGLALWLVPKQILAAQTVWQAGILGAITLALYILEQPEIAFLYTLLPLMATVTVGWLAGLLSEALVIAVAWRLTQAVSIAPLSASQALAIAIGGAFTSLLGWAVTRTLLTVAQWALSNFQQSQTRMEQVRQHRMELEQTQEDLLHANRELARLSDRLKAMYQIAEEARQAKEAFVANVSHELRTPLNMIISFSEMITQSPEVYGETLPPALLADVSAIQRNSRHLARLVDDVLDLSQIDAGRLALSKAWASVPEITQAAVDSMRTLFEAKGLFLKESVAPDLPSLFCDSTRIREVLINLLNNAGRFTEQGGVWVKAWGEQTNIVISVTDTGPGIPVEAQQRIFEPFQQLDSSIRRRYGGSGLGLGISKRLVEMHMGKMWLESEPGVGTTFFFSLPVSTALATATTENPTRWNIDAWEYHMPTRRSRAPVPELASRFVLLEQGNTLQRLFTRYMDEVDVSSVHDLEGAIRELHRSPAQALIVNAPPLIETASPLDHLGDLPYGTPAITCWIAGQEEAAECLGVARYLVKPITRETLMGTLQNLGEINCVLVVDDDTESLQLFARMLSSADNGYHVLQASSGQQALSILRDRRPDVMLLDLVMPEMDGLQVLEEKRNDATIADIPVITVSARDPSSEAIASNKLTVMRSGELSAPEILNCIRVLSELLAPSA